MGAAAVFETACEGNEAGSTTHMRVTTYGRDTHLEQLNSKFASTNLLVYERDTSLVDEKHRVRDTSKGFV